MKTRLKEFNPKKFSFHQDPVLILEDFWSKEERDTFLAAMEQAEWKKRSEIQATNLAFPNCGDWLKAKIGPTEGSTLLDRIALPCIANYIESFSHIRQRHMSFSYYSYGVGDCLSTHNDTDEQYARDDTNPGQGPQPLSAQRRIAVVTYFHQEWEHDWGGELIVYDSRKKKDGQVHLEVSYCLEPKPGSIVFFTVPRFHRVCRVDPLANDHRRMSIAGWFMTEHFS
jgi:SM-20-related protein